jgi:hypothetical protein
MTGVVGALALGAEVSGDISLLPSANGAEQSKASSVPKGSLRIECSRLISGGEREVRLSNKKTVKWTHESVPDPQEGDGVSDSIDYYTFTPKAKGTVGVEIADYLPWMEMDEVEALFWLDVDKDLNMKRREVDPIKKFELQYEEMEGNKEVIVAKPAKSGYLNLSCYTENRKHERSDERSINVTPLDVTALFVVNDVYGWNKFDKATDAEDGARFTFKATLESGKTIKAKGENAFPKRFDTVREGLYAFLGGL